MTEPGARHGRLEEFGAGRPSCVASGAAAAEHGLRHAAFPILRWDLPGSGTLLVLEAARTWAEAAAPHALDHAIATWEEQGAQFDDYADFTRHGYRCTAPGCTGRRNLQSHHIVFRSAGGPDEPSNRTTLCAFHHLRGIHAGTVSCHGRAPEALVFALGVRASAAPRPLGGCAHERMRRPRPRSLCSLPEAAWPYRRSRDEPQ